MGSPKKSDWPEGIKLAAQIGFSFPKFVSTSLSTIIPNACEEAIDLMEKMLQFNPQKRPTAQQCLEHDYFKDFVSPVQNSIYGKSGSKGFFNKNNEVDSTMRKSSAVSKRLESRKSKLESRGVNKNSFYKSRQQNGDKGSQPPANSYFNKPIKAVLPNLEKDSSKGFAGRMMMGSGERNRSLPSGKQSPGVAGSDSNSGGILGKYYKNNQGTAGAQEDATPSGVSKYNFNSDAYGLYGAGAGGGGLSKGGAGGLGGFTKISRKDSRKDSRKGDRPPVYSGANYGGISKYGNAKDEETKGEHFPSVTNKNALESGAKFGVKPSAASGSKEGNRSKLASGGLSGFGGLKKYDAKGTNEEEGLPNLNKYSGAGGLGGLSKGGLGAGSGGLGRYNL